MPVGRISCSATTFEWRSSNGAGRRRDEHELRHLAEELVEAERPVVERRREPEAVVDERLLARAVALVHAADLRHGLVRLVDEDDEVVGEVVDQRERVRARRPALEVARVVLDPVAEAELLHHLEVVLGALPDPVRLEHLPLRLEHAHLLGSSSARMSSTARSIVGFEVTYSVAGQIDEVVELREDLAGERVEVRDRLDLVAEERDPVRGLDVRRLHLDDVALHAEAAAAEHRVVADVLALDQLAQRLVAVVRLPHLEDRARARATPPASRGRRCTRPRRRRRRRGA